MAINDPAGIREMLLFTYTFDRPIGKLVEVFFLQGSHGYGAFTICLPN